MGCGEGKYCMQLLGRRKWGSSWQHDGKKNMTYELVVREICDITGIKKLKRCEI